MQISEMPINKSIWAVADLGDVIYNVSQEWVNSEFPTQHHVVLAFTDGHLWLSNDDQSIVTKFKGQENVDIAVLAFTDMLLAHEHLEAGED